MHIEVYVYTYYSRQFYYYYRYKTYELSVFAMLVEGFYYWNYGFLEELALLSLDYSTTVLLVV
jgi:hypothetical protein